MKEIIVSDFDGTITVQDTLYTFFKTYAKDKWLDIENMWTEGKIGSMECLKKQFELVENMSEEFIDKYISSLQIDSSFKDFIRQNNRDFVIVSDGVDYFINKILENNRIENIKVVSNHAEFIDDKFTLSFPNKNSNCKNKSGTCKCSVVSDLRKKYDKIIYIGDGQSDFCVAKNADILFAKGSLLKYCQKNNINHIEYSSYKDILSELL